MTGSPDFNLWKLSTDNGKMVNRTPLFPLQYFLIILCYGLVHPLTSGGFNLDAIEGIFDSRIRCLVFWINHEIFFSFFQWQLLSKEPSCLDIQVMKTAEQLIAFNIMIIKFWSSPEQKRKKATSLISAGLVQTFTGALIPVSSPSPSSWPMFRFKESGFQNVEKMRSMFYKET